MLRILRAKRSSKKVSIKRLAKVFQISRSTIYYRSKGERQENLRIMELIEEFYRKDPTLGWRRIKVKVEKTLGVRVNHKRIKRLMQKMGLKAICPRKRRRRIKIEGETNLLPYFFLPLTGGSQFLGSRFRTYLENLGIRMSRGEKGFKDNVYVERFWRSYKWECVF